MMEQEKDRANERGISVKQMLLILGVLVFMAAGIWAYNLNRLKNVSFEGLTRYSEAEFMERLDGGFLTSLTPFFCLSDTFLQKASSFSLKPSDI